ncbi:MAG: hypothetical protein IT366_12780 [Candidatus Hydrogenedentes bacterium]|nr:hypothetical protein [Candidatus Hydrogenedentota bacterium]
MTKLERIEQEIATLSPSEMEELRLWMHKQDYDEWDRQMETDFQAGKFDRLIQEGIDDFKAGKTTPL